MNRSEEHCVYMEAYGCSANQSDSEIMGGLLSKEGLKFSAKPESADILIINTCYVKQATETKILRRIKELRESYPQKKIIITGCMPDAISAKLRNIAPNASLISASHIIKIGSLIRSILEGKRVELLGPCKAEKIGLPKIKKNNLLEIVQICSGCLGNCFYCGTKLSRGTLHSYPQESIAKEIKIAQASGAKEFWLTGQDTSCYGFDNNTNLPNLLEKILEMDGDFFVRLGMLNPNNLEKIIDPLIKVCRDERVFKFFHIPVQSGSNAVLKSMNRNYKTESFEKIVKNIRENFPLVTIGTDIIVGYPTENDSDFNQTIEMLERVRPEWINISRFSPRQGTAAEHLKPLDSAILKERSALVHNVSKRIAFEQTQNWFGWSGKVLITQKGIGKNFAHREIVSKNLTEIGKFVNVRVERVEGAKIFGKVIRN